MQQNLVNKTEVEKMSVKDLYMVMDDDFTIRIDNEEESTLFFGHPRNIPVSLIERRVKAIKISFIVDMSIVIE